MSMTPEDIHQSALENAARIRQDDSVIQAACEAEREREKVQALIAGFGERGKYLQRQMQSGRLASSVRWGIAPPQTPVYPNNPEVISNYPEKGAIVGWSLKPDSVVSLDEGDKIGLIQLSTQRFAYLIVDADNSQETSKNAISQIWKLLYAPIGHRSRSGARENTLYPADIELSHINGYKHNNAQKIYGNVVRILDQIQQESVSVPLAYQGLLGTGAIISKEQIRIWFDQYATLSAGVYVRVNDLYEWITCPEQKIPGVIILEPFDTWRDTRARKIAPISIGYREQWSTMTQDQQEQAIEKFKNSDKRCSQDWYNRDRTENSERLDRELVEFRSKMNEAGYSWDIMLFPSLLHTEFEIMIAWKKAMVGLILLTTGTVD